MLLERHDAERFFRLHRTLMFFVNQRLKVIADPIASPEDFSALSPEHRHMVREAFSANLDLIDSFVKENPARLPKGDLDIVSSWRQLVTGEFYVFRDLKKYTVFLSTTSPAVAYGVLGLAEPFDSLIGSHLPILVKTVLLPFQGAIVYDGLMSGYNISFGPGIRRSLNESYQEAKEQFGIVTSLPMSAGTLPPKAQKTRPVRKPPSKEQKDEVLSIIVGLLNQFCHQHLNEEYAVLCRKLAEKLARKRPSPLLQGKPNAWASGIVRAIGCVNFLHDKSQTPYMQATDIDRHLGTSPSSGAARSAAIRKMFDMFPFEPEWTLPSGLDDNPMVWMLQVNGFTLDARHASRDIQEIAFHQGLIPYIPADRKQGE